MGNIGPRLISFVLMPFFTYWLSEADFGIQDIIVVYSVLLVPYITLGLYEAVFVFPKNKQIKDQQSYFTSSLITIALMQLAFGILLLALPQSIIRIVLPDKLSDWLIFLYLLIVVQSYQRLLQSFTRGIDKMKVFGFTGIVYALVMLTLSLWLVPTKGLMGYWIALLVADSSSIIYSFIAIKGWSFLRINKNTKDRLKEMLAFSVPLIPNATMWWIINSINRPLLIDHVGIDGVGLYAVAGKFPSVISLVFTIFFSAFQISALEEFQRDNFQRFYTNIFRALLCVQIVITIFFELFGGLLFDWFIDNNFHSAVKYLPILCLGVCFSNIAAYVGVTFTVIKKTKYFLYSALLGAIVAVISNVFFIPLWGIMGACLAIILSQMSMGLYRYFKSLSYVSFERTPNILYQILLLCVTVLIYYYVEIAIIQIVVEVCSTILLVLLNRDLISNLVTVFHRSKV